jgi:hypothetical protein
MKELDRKLGPLKLWQWGLIGGGTVLAYYLYEKHKGSGAEVNPEEEEKLLGGLEKAGGGGGSGGSEGSTSQTVPSTSTGPEGAPGIAGPSGEPGGQGPQGEAPSAGLEAKVSALEEDQVKNNPPTGSHNGAAQALPKGEFRNNGAVERTFVKGNGIFHQYLSGPKKGTVFRVGTVHKPAKKTKRVTKPAPLHKKVAAKKVAHPAKKKEPVHHK